MDKFGESSGCLPCLFRWFYFIPNLFVFNSVA